MTVRDLANKGRLGFVYSYSYFGKGEDFGQIDLQAVKNLRTTLEQKLSSEQIENKAPIFQNQAFEAARYTALLIRQTRRGNNSNLLATVNTPSLMQHLFAHDGEISLANLNKEDEKTKQIAAYLPPQIQNVRTAMKTEQATRKSKEETDFDITKNGEAGEFGIGIGIKGIIGLNFGVGSSSEHARGREVKNRLETATGTEWQCGKEETTLIPHKIRTYKFIKGSDQLFIQDQSSIFIAVDTNNFYYEDLVVDMSFTEKIIKDSSPIQAADLSGFEGVPLGAVIPFFGAKPPKGFRLCNGNDPKDYPKGDNVFPHADWVPKHLVGMPLPDLREHLIGGAKDPKEVGLIFDKGALNVDGGNFKVEVISEEKDARLTHSHCYVTDFDGNFVGKRIHVITKHGGGFDNFGRPTFVIGIDSFTAVLNRGSAPKYTEKSPGRVSGTQMLKFENKRESLPAHLMCGWIIRIE